MLSTTSKAGVTIVECLMALVLLSIGLLSATGTVGAAARLMRAGDMSATAARRLVSIADSLRGTVTRSAGSCAAIGGGISDEGALELAWSVATVPGGRDIELTVGYAGRAHRDTVVAHVACL